jgi:site-specific DNA recombinase
LRGSLYCAECGGRLLYGKYRGKTGSRYEYFSCIKRRSRRGDGGCTSRHFPAALVERAIEQYYPAVRLPERVRQLIRDDVRHDADERSAVIDRDIERHQRQITKLTENQARLVQLSYRGLVSDEVLAHEQARLDTEKQTSERLLHQAQLQAQDVEASLEGALAKTATPHATYIASTPLERRLLNQTFFKRLLIGEDSQVLGATLTPVYAALSGWKPGLGRLTSTTTPKDPGARHGKPRRRFSGPGFERRTYGGSEAAKTKPSS